MGILIADVLAALEGLAPEIVASLEVRDALEAEAKRGEEYAKTIAPVGPYPHRLASGYVDNPGDYRDSIEGTVVFEKGEYRGRVRATDYKAHWLEYGTRKMPKQAIMRRTAGHLRGTDS